MKAVFGVSTGSVPSTNTNANRFQCLASLPLTKGFTDTARFLCNSPADPHYQILLSWFV